MILSNDTKALIKQVLLNTVDRRADGSPIYPKTIWFDGTYICRQRAKPQGNYFKVRVQDVLAQADTLIRID